MTNDKIILAWKGSIVAWDLPALWVEPEAGRATMTPIHASTIPPKWDFYDSDMGKSEMTLQDGSSHRLGKHMFWLPKDALPYLDPPESSYVIRQRRIKMDTTQLINNDNWEECHKEQPEAQCE